MFRGFDVQDVSMSRLMLGCCLLKRDFPDLLYLSLSPVQSDNDDMGNTFDFSINRRRTYVNCGTFSTYILTFTLPLPMYDVHTMYESYLTETISLVPSNVPIISSA